MTIREVIQKSAAFLQERGVESPRLQAEHLLGHVLKLPRLQLYLQFDRVLTEAELNPLRELVRRRGAREPLQHLTGTANFCGFEFRVNRHVLVPRPETELLAERAKQFLQLHPGATVLDLGTGSGCLPIVLARWLPGVRLTTADISAEALAVARENAQLHATGEAITFLLSDLFSALPADACFDLIISNPPYIPSGDIAGLQPEVRDFDPRAALDGGVDGLEFYRRIALEGRNYLKPQGELLVEFGDGQEEALKKLFEGNNWVVAEVVDDYSRRPRILSARPA